MTDRTILLRRRTALLGGAALLAAPALVRAQEKVVNVYSSRHYDTDRALYDGFTEVSGGVRVRLIEGDADQLIERIRNEGANSPADVLITVDAARLVRAMDANVLAPTRSATLESRVPAHLRDPDGHWFGLSKRARVLIVPKDWTPPKPLARYEDIADPAFRNTILVRTASHVYNISLAGSILAANGEAAFEQWARGVVANMARPPQGGDTDQIMAVAAGQGRIAVSNTYYFARLIRSSKAEDRQAAEKLKVIFPNQEDRGTHVNISGAGVVRTAPNRDAAVAFVEYLTSVKAQEMFARGNNEYPVVDEVNVVPEVAAWGRFKEDRLNAVAYARNGAKALEIMQRVGWR
ncbi:extracellular solute-binding protein [Elioraea sp. Yellowstone]|jgi:iron(III) transport system substrate-binding protein|uniref:extracellular solute-binding protein n=1 Tax=Elioraea sp. Yellowstone TaxID=2592070 RepID=UPI00115000F1|nr:extracellular solute-binding protein [Elioraea sp. Yellowstone]TQF80652.1 extracellular solute-binding protein [Elioraea sp. Yellowstone]